MQYNLQEIEIKISIGFSIETHSNLKIIDMMVYTKCGLLLKVIISVFRSRIKIWTTDHSFSYGK